MKTTLVINDSLVAQLKREAARQSRTMSEIVEIALRLLFQKQKPHRRQLRPLPKFNSGGHLVNIDDRDALFNAMEGHR